jgi:hypothetical protein
MRRGRSSWKKTTPDPDMDEEGEDDVGACSRGTPGPAAPDDGGDVEHVSGDEYSNVCCLNGREGTAEAIAVGVDLGGCKAGACRRSVVLVLVAAGAWVGGGWRKRATAGEGSVG